jgi:predicted ATPase
LAQVEGLAARQPVLMVFEDVHWSDPTTRESPDLLIDRVPTLRVLVILTFRPEFTPPWIGRPHVMLLALPRLALRQRAQMIVQVTGGKALPKEIADQIVDRTGGVPLFIEELTKSVIESGIVTEAGDHYAAMGPAAPLAIPTTLQGSLLARLDRLAPTREVAQIGAALGRQFSHELISAVAISMSFSANLSAYSDMPSFLSQPAICCIAGTKVGRGRVFGPPTSRASPGRCGRGRRCGRDRNKKYTTDRNGTSRQKAAPGRTRHVV